MISFNPLRIRTRLVSNFVVAIDLGTLARLAEYADAAQIQVGHIRGSVLSMWRL